MLRRHYGNLDHKWSRTKTDKVYKGRKRADRPQAAGKARRLTAEEIAKLGL